MAVQDFVARVRNRKVLSTALILLTLAIGILLGTLISTGVRAQRQAAAPDATPLSIPSPVQLSNSFSQVAKRVSPAVVNINAETLARPTTRRRRPSDEEGEDPREEMFRRFFGRPFEFFDAPQGQRSHHLGSGVIVDPNGYILTNNHVIAQADRIRVKLKDDSTLYDAKVIGADPETDLAVIKVETRKQLATAKLGNSDAVQVGDWAIAIGSPLGFDETMTAGIISAKGRQIGGGRQSQFQRYIQTDAAINLGNSGGPLLNINGEVIGINTAIVSTTGGFDGLGFAMPSNVAINVFNQIIKGGKVIRGSIGIGFSEPTDNSRDAALRVYGAKEGGVIVNEVEPGGPAEKGGLKPEDVIIAIDGKTVRNGDDLVGIVAGSAVGAKLKLTLLRDKDRMELPVEVGDRTEVFKERNAQAREEPAGTRQGTEEMFGIRVSNLTREQRRQWEYEDPNGVAVVEVDPSSFAADIGLQKNDIIVSINRRPVSSVQDVKLIQRDLKPGSDVAFRIMRRDRVSGRAQWRALVLAGSLPPNA